jgi:hypothetical protein
MRGLHRLATVVAVFCLAVGLATGCGDGRVKADNRYVTATDRAIQVFETRLQGLQADFTPGSTPQQDRRTLGALRRAVDKVVADLQAIRPPDRIAPLHRRLIAEVGAYRGAIDAARTGFASSDPQVIDAARSRFAKRLTAVGKNVTRTITTINAELK